MNKFGPLLEMPSAQQMSDIGAAAELLLEAMASACAYDVPKNTWHTLKVSVCRRADGQTIISDVRLDRGF